jgi:site-specific recombinase XerD
MDRTRRGSERRGSRRSSRGPTQGSRPPGRTKDSSGLVTPEEVEALLAACSNHALTGIRNRALILLLYRGGLRVSEALDLRPADLDRATGTLTARGPRSHAQRAVCLEPPVLAALLRWLDRRENLRLDVEDGERPVFCTLRGQRLKSAYVRALLPRLARKAGIAKRVHAGGLRDALAMRLAGMRTPLEVLQAQLGHSSRASTDRYLRQIAPPALLAEIPRRRGRTREGPRPWPRP